MDNVLCIISKMRCIVAVGYSESDSTTFIVQCHLLYIKIVNSRVRNMYFMNRNFKITIDVI